MATTTESNRMETTTKSNTTESNTTISEIHNMSRPEAQPISRPRRQPLPSPNFTTSITPVSSRQSNTSSQSQNSTLSNYTTISFLNTYLLKKRYKSPDPNIFLFRPFLPDKTNKPTPYYYNNCSNYYINEYRLIDLVKIIDNTITNSIKNDIIIPNNLIKYIQHTSTTTDEDEDDFNTEYSTILGELERQVEIILQTNSEIEREKKEKKEKEKEEKARREIQKIIDRQRDTEQFEKDELDRWTKIRQEHESNAKSNEGKKKIINIKIIIQEKKTEIRTKKIKILKTIEDLLTNDITKINNKLEEQTNAITASFNLDKYNIIEEIYDTLSYKINNIINRICVCIIMYNKKPFRISDESILGRIDDNILTNTINTNERRYVSALHNEANENYRQQCRAYINMKLDIIDVREGCFRNPHYNLYKDRLTNITKFINMYKEKRIESIDDNTLILDDNTLKLNNNTFSLEQINKILISLSNIKETLIKTEETLNTTEEDLNRQNQFINKIETDLNYLENNNFKNTYTEFNTLLNICNKNLNTINDLSKFDDYIDNTINKIMSDTYINNLDSTFNFSYTINTNEKKILYLIIGLKYNINNNIEIINDKLKYYCDVPADRVPHENRFNDPCKVLVLKYLMNNIMSKLILHLSERYRSSLLASININNIEFNINTIINHRNGYNNYNSYIYNDNNKLPPTVEELSGSVIDLLI